MVAVTPAQLRPGAARRGDHVRRRPRPLPAPGVDRAAAEAASSGSTSSPSSSGWSDSQWVNQGIYFLFGAGSPSDLTDPGVPGEAGEPRSRAPAGARALFHWFRQPPPPWDSTPRRAPTCRRSSRSACRPSMATGSTTTDLHLRPRHHPTQYEWLRRWAEGEFETGERPRAARARSLEDLPLAEQPAALDRAPLEDCLGGPFHPGIELTWPMRVPSMWRAAVELGGLLFRLNILPAGRDARGRLRRRPHSRRSRSGLAGPLAASGPGTLTRWLGVPWQTDEASCLSGYNTLELPVAPLVLGGAGAQPGARHGSPTNACSMPGLPAAQRMKHLAYRQFWLRDLTASGAYQDRINHMVTNWHAHRDRRRAAGAARSRPEPGWPRPLLGGDRTRREVRRARSHLRAGVRAESPLEPEARGLLAEVTAEALPARTEAERKAAAAAAAAPRPPRRSLRSDQRLRLSSHVVVAGGGPAGAVTALVLARRGLRVVVLESRAAPERKVGECLPPSLTRLLRDLGLEDLLRRRRAPALARQPLGLGLRRAGRAPLPRRHPGGRLARGPARLRGGPGGARARCRSGVAVGVPPRALCAADGERRLATWRSHPPAAGRS